MAAQDAFQLLCHLFEAQRDQRGYPYVHLHWRQTFCTAQKQVLLNSHLLEFDAILEVLDWCVEIAVRTAVCVHARMVFQEMCNALTEAVYELS